MDIRMGMDKSHGRLKQNKVPSGKPQLALLLRDLFTYPPEDKLFEMLLTVSVVSVLKLGRVT